MTPKLNIIVGSTRPGRVGPTIARWVEQEARAHGGFEVELVDLAAFGLPLFAEPSHPIQQDYRHEPTQRWSRSVAAADAFLFVTPEYDFFPPASLVNAVQVVMQEWWYKPAGVVSYGGISGGLRAAQGLRQLLGNVNVHALPQTVPVPLFPQFIGEDGQFRPNDEMAAGAKAMLGELHRWALALGPLREPVTADAEARAA